MSEYQAWAQRHKMNIEEIMITHMNHVPGDSLYFYDPDHHKLEIHVGNWQTRVAVKKANLGAWKNVEWFV